MHSRSFLNILLPLIFGAIILALQGGVWATDTPDRINPVVALRARDTLHSTDGLLEKRGFKKFIKAVIAVCKKNKGTSSSHAPSSTSAATHPVPSSSLANLYESIKGDKKVAVGQTSYWPLSPKTAAKFTTAEFYGCTIIIAVDGKGVVIGHYHEAKNNDCKTLDSEAQTQTAIIHPLMEGLAQGQFDTKTMVFIIHSSLKRQDAPGYKLIKRLLMEEGELSADRIKEYPYSSGSGTGSFPHQPKGKAVVEWIPTEEGATMNVYFERDTPRFIAHYDSKGDWCDEQVKMT